MTFSREKESDSRISSHSAFSILRFPLGGYLYKKNNLFERRRLYVFSFSDIHAFALQRCGFNLLLGFGALGGSLITIIPDTDIHFLREGERMEFYKMELHWNRTSHTKK